MILSTLDSKSKKNGRIFQKIGFYSTNNIINFTKLNIMQSRVKNLVLVTLRLINLFFYYF
ncbi:MAG: hypothetical protein A2Y25_02380 [Candidatus Melainabacteria bacterium GWF2_37_15]|nr:MAG: hypothetical protein A2Y25_02380 [Candidatus Melainabacteria bacterium GWF2_37_15]